MKHIFFVMILLGLLSLRIDAAEAQNPFTSKPETFRKIPEPALKSRLFVKMIMWQHQLREKMSESIRAAQYRKNFKPLLLLMGVACAYGAIHAAGPGHGKFVAMSYILSQKASIAGGLLFALYIAVIHAFSGVVGVLGLRYIIHRSVSETLDSVTGVTQTVSFALIALLGMGIFLKHGVALFFKSNPETETSPVKASKKALLPWALAVGLVPCPAVVMVMLFCLSMDVMILGLVLSACISLGMAATIALIVVAVVVGKAELLNLVSKKRVETIEKWGGMLSGAAISVFGTLFLLATIGAAI